MGGSQDVGGDLQSYVSDLPVPHEAEDAALLLLDFFRGEGDTTGATAGSGGGSGDAVPAAAVACGALPQLERLATGSLSDDRNVIELWHLCRVAHHAVRCKRNTVVLFAVGVASDLHGALVLHWSLSSASLSAVPSFSLLSVLHPAFRSLAFVPHYSLCYVMPCSL